MTLRMEFPGNKEISRRTFLDYLLGFGVLAWLTAVLYPIVEYFKVPKQTEACSIKRRRRLSQRFEAESRKSDQIRKRTRDTDRHSGRQTQAYSAVCTHLQCTVQYRPDMEKIYCACHGGVYDLNGRNISGPPPRPLQEYKVAFKGDDIIVSKS